MKHHIARKLLKVTPHATNTEIKNAWKREMILHHPDKNNNAISNVEYCKLLNEAKNTLTNTMHGKIDYRNTDQFDSFEEECIICEDVWKWFLDDYYSLHE